jgi:hypothetical protein
MEEGRDPLGRSGPRILCDLAIPKHRRTRSMMHERSVSTRATQVPQLFILCTALLIGCAAPRPAKERLVNQEPLPAVAAVDSHGYDTGDLKCYRGRQSGGGLDSNGEGSASAPRRVGTLSRGAIYTTLDSNNVAFWACIRPREGQASVAGHVETEFTIAADGAVAESRVVDGAGGDLETEDCIGRALCGVVFPKPAGGGNVEVHQTFRFHEGAIVASCYLGHGEVRPSRLKMPRRPDAGVETTAVPSLPKPIRGSLDKEVIRDVIRGHIDAVRWCYETRLAIQSSLQGRVNAQFVIAPDGTVSVSGVSSTTLNDTAVEDCVGKEICAWEFPRPVGGGIVIVSYPFNFTFGR